MSTAKSHKIETFDLTEFFENRDDYVTAHYFDFFEPDEELSPVEIENRIDALTIPDAITSPQKFLEQPAVEVTDFENISTRIKKVRTTFGLTQKQMATVLDMKQPTYSDIEKEGSQPSAKTITAIAAFFNISLAYFYGLTNQFLLLNDYRTFYRVNGHTLLDFITPEKIKDIMVSNCREYYIREHIDPLNEARQQEYYESFDYYCFLKKKFENSTDFC